MSVRRRERLGELAGSAVELVGAGGRVERLRAVKDEREIKSIAAAARLVDEIYEWLFAQRLSGRSERELAVSLEHEMRMRGASAPSFDSIVASARTVRCLTLSRVTWRSRQATSSPSISGRGSTATAPIARAPSLSASLESTPVRCTRWYSKASSPGSPRSRRASAAAKADAAARAVIDAGGYGEQFGHGLGHGVGIEIHEAPRLSRTASEDPLVAGNVVTVEPGIYLPGEFGVRIEDLVVVRDGGAEILSHFTKELLVLE